jgi:uncharacterized membrane protein
MMLDTLEVYVFSLIAAIVWGLASVVAKRGLTNGGTALLLGLLGSFCGSIIFWGVLFFQRGFALLSHLTPAMVVVFALAGLSASGIGRLIYFTGLDRVGATIGQAGVSIHPLFATLLAFLFLAEPIRLVELGGVVVIVAGLIVFSFTTGGDRKGWRSWELIFPIGAAFLYALADVFRRYGFTEIGATPIEGIALNTTAAFVGLSCYVLLGHRNAVNVPREAYRAVGRAAILLPLGLLSFMTALSLGRVVVAVPIANIAPLFTIFFGYFLIGDLERITRGVLAGSGCIIIGVYLLVAM